MMEYVISRGPGTLIEMGIATSRGHCAEIFDDWVDGIPAMAIYTTDKEVQHVKKGAYSMTTIPKGYVH